MTEQSKVRLTKAQVDKARSEMTNRTVDKLVKGPQAAQLKQALQEIADMTGNEIYLLHRYLESQTDA